MFNFLKDLFKNRFKASDYSDEDEFEDLDEIYDPALPSKGREDKFYFSIVTESGRYILCRVWDWSKVDKKYWQNRFLKQLEIVDSYNGIFEIHSEQPIPDDWKRWFSENRIVFQEG